ncbi:hypothetical protein ACMV_P3_00570 (plasmid) [Acidiphilium multivorum AIU301]|uniref:Uncharacterized protein n=1 Tax=Acidiphilium multivorum (strain DSM 11245 / JCM 8867 / NBRC 100883 / AIU 301) TaxID=926570 RepID=F0J7Y9_ACIMA|nr:hypothetical protein ACMV_P3_00570 [Acidiphilium multivorum AIU301]GAN74612.1 hypothetical protein Apmu_0195_02 [Acidiphilium multivorum AIU301]
MLRIMQANGLVLARHTAYRPARTHDGVVIALRSNIRWCSDHLELKCRNGDIVRVLFVIDDCDREIIAWSAVAHVLRRPLMEERNRARAGREAAKISIIKINILIRNFAPYAV